MEQGVTLRCMLVALLFVAASHGSSYDHVAVDGAQVCDAVGYVLTQTGRAHPMGSDQKQSDGSDISTQACKPPSISMQICSRHCIA